MGLHKRLNLLRKFDREKHPTTMVGDFINTMKTTFEFNINLNLAVKQHGYTKMYKSREFINLKASLNYLYTFNSKNNQNFKKSRLQCSDLIAYHRI